MNVKRWIVAGVAAFAVVFLLDAIVHGNLLMSLYEQTAPVWRPRTEGNQKMWLMSLGQLFFAFVLAWFYTLGYEPNKSGLGQGIRFGIYVGILLVAAQNFVWYVVLPIPFILNLGWLGSTFINSLVAGLVIGLVYRNKK